MGLLSLIKEDESYKYISLKEAINLLAERTRSNIYEVAVYLLNKNVESSIHCYKRGMNYKIYETSRARYDRDGWTGDNYAFDILKSIIEREKDQSSLSIHAYSQYGRECEEVFWDRTDFFDLECISSLNLFESEEFTEDRQQIYIWDQCYLNIQQEDAPPKAELLEDQVVYDFNVFEESGSSFESWTEDQQTTNYPLFYKNDTFTVQEAACLISGYDPIIVGNAYKKLVWLRENPDYDKAINFIYAFVRGGLFEETDSGEFVIKSEKLKDLLFEKDILIEGFNDYHLPTKEYQLLERIELLREELEKEKAHSMKLDLSLLEEQVNFEKSERENQKLKVKIQELTAEQMNIHTSTQCTKLDLLSLIFDESATDRYAPDLVLSIKLWKAIYIDNPKNDSHSNKANNWISMNTDYELTRPSATKLREITNPLVNWSTHRDRNYKK